MRYYSRQLTGAILLQLVAQLDSPLTEPVSSGALRPLRPVGLGRTNCPVLVFDSSGVTTLERMLVWMLSDDITELASPKPELDRKSLTEVHKN